MAELSDREDPVVQDPVRTELADRIAAAFDSAPQPDPPLTIEGGPFERDVDAALSGKSADELTAEDALAVRLDLWALTPEAFRYYVPALARMFLVGETEVDALGEGLITALTPSQDAATRAKLDERVGPLDAAQREALGEFVCWYLDVEEDVPRGDAAAEYWNCG